MEEAITVAELVRRSHSLSKQKGWYELWEEDGRTKAHAVNVPEKLALIHSEVSEALEEFRKHGVEMRCPDCNGDGKCPAGTPDAHCWKCRGRGFLAMYAAEMQRDPENQRYVLASKPEGLVVELADAVIRIADLCGALGLDLAAAIEIKHRYNETRSFRHGGKRA
jgi:hypothetical protein